jgi:hypothetical protein
MVWQEGVKPQLFINGSFQTLTDWMFANHYDSTYIDAPFGIGNGTSSYDNVPFCGTIDDVQIYNRALSSNEVAALYNAQASQYTNTFTGLTNGVHTLRAYAQTTSGSITNTGLRTFTVAP